MPAEVRFLHKTSLQAASEHCVGTANLQKFEALGLLFLVLFKGLDPCFVLF